VRQTSERQAKGAWAYALSADSMVKPTDYPPGVERKIARLFQRGDSATLCFGADDMMRSDVSTAFLQAVLDYVNDPSSLGTLLAGMQKTQNGVKASPLANRACAQPGAR
jgi:hypothetical protein